MSDTTLEQALEAVLTVSGGLPAGDGTINRDDLASELADVARRLLGWEIGDDLPCGAMVTMVWVALGDGKPAQAVTAWCGTRSGPCPYPGGSVLVHGRHTRTCRAEIEGQDAHAVVEA